MSNLNVLEALLLVEELRKSLEKRSKNVREQTRNITPAQAEGRRARYAESIGLRPEQSPAKKLGNTPLAAQNSNILPYSERDGFPLSHELGHAIATQPGESLREMHDRINGLSLGPAGASPTEDAALAGEVLTDRRAGVGAGLGNDFREDYITARRSGQPAAARALGRATRQIERFDDGATFDGSGRVRMPTTRSVTKSEPAKQWRGRPIVRDEDAQELDHAATAAAIQSGSATEGERLAYEQYAHAERLDAAAHHYHHAAKALSQNNRELYDRHMLAYAQHALALALNPADKPPPEVAERVRQMQERGSRGGFRSHGADGLGSE